MKKRFKIGKKQAGDKTYAILDLLHGRFVAEGLKTCREAKVQAWRLEAGLVSAGISR